MIGPYFAQDYQVHSYCSHDGRASIREHCIQAVRLGLDEIGFSEHKDFDPADPCLDHFQYADYRGQIERAREEFGGALNIRMGVEVDYQKWFEEEIERFLARSEFDFVIGSVHYIDRAMLMTDSYMRGRDPEEAYRAYFGALIDSVECGLIDILGHMEYANKRGISVCGPYDPTPYRDLVAKLFRAMMSRNVALEINTSGLRQEAENTYPCAAHVGLYREMGGRLLTIGSDAHHVRDLAANYAIAAELALESGLSELTTWNKRTPAFTPLVRSAD